MKKATNVWKRHNGQRAQLINSTGQQSERVQWKPEQQLLSSIFLHYMSGILEREAAGRDDLNVDIFIVD